MLQVNYIRNNQQEVIEKLKIKNFNAAEILDQVIVLDDQRKSTQKQLDDSLAEANKAAKEIGGLYKRGKREEAEALKTRTGELKVLTKELGDSLENTIKILNGLLVQ